MAVAYVGSGAASGHAMARLTVRPTDDLDYSYSPETDDLWVLYVYAGPGVMCFGPTGWHREIDTQRTTWKGRQVDASVFWWRFPPVEMGRFYEWSWPSVDFVDASVVDLELRIYRGVQPTELSTTTTVPPVPR